jgi:ketosteroid isomerase-like protein
VSEENVELVLGLVPGTDVDLAQLVRDDEIWTALVTALTPFFHPDLESVVAGLPTGEITGLGIDGFRAVNLEWFAPWESYRQRVERSVDLGEKVLLLNRDFGRIVGSTQDVEVLVGNLYTLRDGKIARWEAFNNRAEALEAVGLSE